MQRLSVPAALVAGCLGMLLVLTTTGCSRSAESGSSGETEGAAEARASAVPDSVNTLTAEERSAGWKLLFDGNSFEGWRGFQSDSMPDDWTIEDGAMYYTGADDDAPDDIVTTEAFGDFDLRFEWKISPGGNSGIMYRVSEDHDTPWASGPEVQVLDNEGHPNGEDPLTSAGALYELYAPAQDVTKPVGQYNEARIIARGNHVEHWLNGTKLLEYDIGSEDWKQRVAGSKFSEMPGFAAYEEGLICLQDHGDPVWYRDLKIRHLEEES